ncbi:DUF481 domain-containing protein, partial [candidate division GN15 bacterium]|nr:DUF481 domain-containing protein [candidate division GN15 bacterium]
HLTFSISEFTSVQSDGGSIVNDGFSHLRYNYQASSLMVIEAFLQGQYDRSQDLQQRYLAGGGLRLIAIETDRYGVAVGVSSMYEWEELTSGATTSLARSSNYLSLSAEKKKAWSLSTTTYVQPAWEDFGDTRVLIESDLSVDLATFLAVTADVTYRHDSEPPSGTKHYDLTLKNGLKVMF